MNILLIIISLFLLVISIIDFKVKAIPSILLTAMLFLVVALSPYNLVIGLLGFIMAYMLYEGKFFSGVADIKVMTIISFFIPNLAWLSIFIITVLILGLAWKSSWYYTLTKKNREIPSEFPFVPVFFFSFMTMIISGGII